MIRLKLIGFFMSAGLVSACGAPQDTTPGQAFEAVPLASVAEEPATQAEAPAPLRDIHVDAISVRVPDSLTVSEANQYLPQGDIVWRGDPIGDRRAQVGAIFEEAFARGAAPLDGALGVMLDVEVTRFHALTEKARYTVGGVHNINFNLTLRDPETGAALSATRTVRADLDAFGGEQALRAEAAGQTQKVRITDHLAEVIRVELTTKEGFQNPRLGLIQAMNQM